VHVHVFPPELIERREWYLARDAWFSLLYSSPGSRMATVDQLLEQMDSDGVDHSVIFGFAFRDQSLCRFVNDYVLDAVKEHPGRLLGLACVSPESPGALQELERCLQEGLQGCGELMPDGQGFDPLASPGLARVAGSLVEQQLPLLLHANEPVGHTYAGKGRVTPQVCFSLAESWPELDLILAHLGGGLFLYELMPEVRQTLSRVYYDTSAVPYLYRPEVYAVVAAAAGAKKLLFGSDYPLLAPARYLSAIRDSTGADRGEVLGGNAQRLFRLSSL
jgi:predicted TIM-barrel fold metal-dependent hydrolase